MNWTAAVLGLAGYAAAFALGVATAPYWDKRQDGVRDEQHELVQQILALDARTGDNERRLDKLEQWATQHDGGTVTP